MKLHHALALTLIGWYLMYPPPPRPDHESLEPGPDWTILAGFQTKAECKAAQSKTMQSAWPTLKGNSGAPGGATDPKFLAQQLLISQCRCVADDDPRLKGD